jgi:hypothetical protein
MVQQPLHPDSAQRSPARRRSAVTSACLLPTVVVGFVVLAAASAQAQEPACRILCSPTFNVEPTITFEPLFGRPRVATDGGAPEREDRSTVFEMVFALDVPTRAPRLGFTFEAIVAPFGRTDENPFTGSSSAALGGDIRDNPVQIESELNLTWLAGEQTGGWVESHFDIVDQFSPAKRPTDRSVYTHKLNFELDTSVAFFNWLPDGSWLKGVEIEGSLDYLTGLPRAGDVVGGERFVDDASPWSFSLVFVIPVVPLP